MNTFKLSRTGTTARKQAINVSMMNLLKHVSASQARFILCLDSQAMADAKLLDRTAALEAEKAANPPDHGTTSGDSALPLTSNDGTAQIRSDLAEALRSNGQLQSRIKAAEAELVKLKAKSKSDGKVIEDLSRERTTLSQKVKDRDEELRGKAKLLDVWRPPISFWPRTLICSRMCKTS